MRRGAAVFRIRNSPSTLRISTHISRPLGDPLSSHVAPEYSRRAAFPLWKLAHHRFGSWSDPHPACNRDTSEQANDAHNESSQERLSCESHGGNHTPREFAGGNTQSRVLRSALIGRRPGANLPAPFRFCNLLISRREENAERPTQARPSGNYRTILSAKSRHPPRT
jgi:hypothetical protein